MRHITLTVFVAFLLPVGAAIVLAGDDPPDAPAGAAPRADATQQAAIARLVQQLGADDFHAREQASKALAGYGEKARSALTEAAAKSGSPEVRWRSQQLLRRLQGAREKPLGAEDHKPAPRRHEAGASDGSELESMLDRVRKQMEDFLKGRPRVGSMGSLFGGRTIEAPGLVLERSLSGAVTLRVKREEQPGGAVVEDVYKGHSLSDILTRNPQLTKLGGMDELKRRDAEQTWPGMEEFKKHFLGWPRRKIETSPQGASGFAFSTSQGVEIRQDAEGVKVKLREKDKDGKEVVREFKGKSLDEIKAAHPELKGRLDGIGFGFHVARPDFFWSDQARRRLDRLYPSPPARSRTPSKLQGAVFGLRLALVSEALASQIGLTSGAGALVDTVVPGTQAETLGLQRHDVITHVNGKSVDRAAAVRALRQAAATNAPLEVTIIRRSKPLTLKR